jgi:hypothetical protein
MKIIKTLLFVSGLAAGGWFFMPWRAAGEFALRWASHQADFSYAYASASASSLTWSALREAPGGFMVEGLEARGLLGMVDLSCQTLTVTPDLAASLSARVLVCHLAFTGGALGEVAVTPLKKIPGITLGDGRVTALLWGQELFLEGLRTNGDLELSGRLGITPSRLLGQADLVVEIKSQAFEREFASLCAALGLPLRRERAGRWILREPGE